MALQSWKGTITVNATGNQTIGSLTDPKAIIMWGTPLAAAGTSAASAHNSFGVGWATDRGGTVAQHAQAMGATSTDPGSSAGGRVSSNSALFLLCDTDGVIDCEIDLVSMDADEVVINVANVDTTANVLVHYLILGGTDLEDAIVVNGTTSTGATKEYTESGFGQPDLVGAMGAGTASAFTTDPGLSIGWGIKDGAQAVHHWLSDDAGSVALGIYQRLDRIYAMSIAAGPVLRDEASLAASSAWPTDGIELTWNDVAPNATDHISFLFLKGTFQSALGVQTMPTGAATQNQDISVGFEPTAAWFHSASTPGVTTYQTDGAAIPNLGSFSMGGSDGTTEGWSGYWDGDAEATQRTRHRLSTTKALEATGQSGTTTTITWSADASFTAVADTLRLAFTTTTATNAAEYIYLALGDAAGGGGTTYEKAGSLVAGSQLYGADVFQATEAGALTARGLGAGADVFQASETGSLTTRALSSGADSFQPVEAGSLTTRATGVGADVFNANETGTAPVGTVLSGVQQHIPAGPVTYEKTGSLTAGAQLRGADAAEFVEAGALTVDTTLAALDAETWQELGTLPVGTVVSGVAVKVTPGFYEKAGTLTAGGQLRGADAATFAETGSLASSALASGVDAATLNRTGVLLVDTLVSGVSLYVPPAPPVTPGDVAVRHAEVNGAEVLHRELNTAGVGSSSNGASAVRHREVNTGSVEG